MSDTMGGVDASIPLRAVQAAPQQQPNPLQTIGSFANVQNAINQTKLFPGQLLLQQQAVQGGQVSLNQKINQAGYQALLPLLAQPNITHSAFTTALASIENNLGIPTSGILQDVMATTPSGDGPQFDAKIRALIGGRSQIDPSTGAAMVTPHIGPLIDTGSAIQPTTVVPPGVPGAGQIRSVGGAYSRTLTPEEATAPTQIGVTPQGQPLVGTRSQFIQRAAAAGAPSVFGTGRYPGGASIAPLGPVADGTVPPPSAAPAAAPYGGLVMAPPPGQSQAMQAAAQPAGDAAGALGAAAADIPMRQAQLSAMLGDLNNASTGPNTPMYSAWMGRLVQLGVPMGAKAQASRENFEKMASQFAQQQAAKLGVITNDKLGTAIMSNPNAAFTTLGNQGVIHVLQGNEDALNAKNQAWQSSGENPANFFKWSQQFNTHFDPRAFWYARMEPAERRTLYTGMTSQDQAKFRSNLDYAIQQRWIDPSSLQVGPSQ